MPDDLYLQRGQPTPDMVSAYIWEKVRPHMPPADVVDRLALLVPMSDDRRAGFPKTIAILLLFAWHEHADWKKVYTELSGIRKLASKLHTALLRANKITVECFEMFDRRPLRSTGFGDRRLPCYGEVIGRFELSLIEAVTKLAPRKRSHGDRSKRISDLDRPPAEFLTALVCCAFHAEGGRPTTNKNNVGEGRLRAFLCEISPYLPAALASQIEAMGPGELGRIRKQVGPKIGKRRRILVADSR